MVDPKEFADFGNKLVEVISTLKAQRDALKALLDATTAERDALKKQADEILGKVLPPETLSKLQALVASLESSLK
jgi:cell division protein FtsB